MRLNFIEWTFPTGADCAREDGDEHGVRLLHEGQQVRLQDRDPVVPGALVETNLDPLGQHARKRRTELEEVGHR